MRTFIAILLFFGSVISLPAEVIDLSGQISSAATSVNAKPFIIFVVIATILIIICLNIGKRRGAKSTFRGPVFDKPSRYDQADSVKLPSEDPVTSTDENVSNPATAMPAKVPARPLLRRFPGAERSDNGHSPLDTAPPPPTPSISNFLDHMLLTAEDLQVDQKDNRDLPLSKSPQSSQTPQPSQPPQPPKLRTEN